MSKTEHKKSTEEGSEEISAKKDFTNVTLNDVAAMLVHLEPSSREGAADLKEALCCLAESSSGKVQELILQAAIKADRLLHADPQAFSRIVLDVKSLIEQAIYASGDKKPGKLAESEPSVERGRDTVKGVEAKRTESLPLEADPVILGEFIAESRELIEAAEAALLELETNPADMEAVGAVFRAFHTVKGAAAFLGLDFISELAHKAETLLSRIRDHEIRYSGGYADLALRSVDMLKSLLQAVQDAMDGELMAKPVDYDNLLTLLSNPEAAGISDEPLDIAELSPRVGDILVAQGRAEREEVEAVAANQGREPIGIAIVKSGTASVTDVAKALRTQQRIKGAESVDSTVRVRIDRLDRLIDMVGELVIAHSMVAQDEVVLEVGNNNLLKKVFQMGKIIRELQELSMSMKMVPLRATFHKMTRLVRDLAHKNNKLINFVTEGEDTEIDRNMVDMINDPLIHMLRNAVDHGIEMPDVREKLGKPREGTIRLAAYHAGGNVVIEVQDDGRGLDREKIINKAIEKGLIEPDAEVSDREIFNLILLPGLSTAELVTEVSGRGVGMDVVKRAVEALRGGIYISSEPGRGSIFTIRLPFTMAITDGMLIKVGDQKYILPAASILATFRPDDDLLCSAEGRGEMVFFHGELIPLYRLHRLFGIEGAIEDPTKGLLVIVGDSINRCALLVDELLGQQQVVAKSLGDGVGKVLGLSGGAILGDGRVGIILDAQEIVMLARQESQ